MRLQETEKKILKSIAETIPRMSEFDKGYLLGMGEAFSQQKQAEVKRKMIEEENS